MALATLAYSVAAGGMALALSTTWLALRGRTRFSKARAALTAELSTKSGMLRELDSATTAFDEAFLAVEGDTVRLVWGEDTLRQCGEALGLKLDEDSDVAPLVMRALGDTSAEAGKGLKALITEGQGCRFEVFAEAPPKSLIETAGSSYGLTLIVEGKSSGATAWVRLAIAGARASLSSGPFAQMAEHLPAPCWICARDGRTMW
ncbi:MAG: two-component sensor histidine kinase, partial [Asticcacaulis sp.]